MIYSYPYYSSYDVNRDGRVDFQDGLIIGQASNQYNYYNGYGGYYGSRSGYYGY